MAAPSPPTFTRQDDDATLWRGGQAQTDRQLEISSRVNKLRVRVRVQYIQ